MTDRPILFSGPMVRAILDGTKSQTRRALNDVPPPPSRDDVLHHPPKHDAPYFDSYCGGRKTALNPRGMTDYWCWWTRDDRGGASGCKVSYVPADRLWVREAYYQRGHWEPVEGKLTKGGAQKWAFVPADDVILFEAPERFRSARHRDDPATVDWHKRLGRFIPRWASRLTLTVTDVRVERLQDISEEDALAEGVPSNEDYIGSHADEYCSKCNGSGVHGGFGANYGVIGVDCAQCETPQQRYRNLWNHINGSGAWDANPWIVAVSFSAEQRNIDQ